MGEPLFLILRRLRRPLLAVVGTIAISILGLANIPGVDANGNPATLGYFHALYIMSFTATTIGFGEVPYPFSDAQRLWVTFSIYISVIAWAYALGVVFHMTRDPAFRQALARSHFAARVRRQVEPFILVVGYGQSGMVLARMLDRIGYNSVIVELLPERVARIETQEYQRTPLFVAGDGRWPETLVDAGVTHPQCQTMVVLAGDDDTTQAVAIGGSALNPNLQIITRARSEMAVTNLEPFHGIEIVNPYETFAFNLGQDFSTPEKWQVREWLTGLPGSQRPDVLKLPIGHWVICGFGRFGHYIAQALTQAGATWTAIDNNPEHVPEPSLLQKSYSQEALSEAGIERSVGFVACTDRDAINLAAVRRARALNPDLFVAVRQMHASNAGLVEATQADLRFIQAEIMSHEVRQLITSPLLNRFLLALRADTGDLAQRVSAQLEVTVQDRVPFLWVFSCMAAYPGLREAFAYDMGNPLRLGDLFVHPHDPSRLLQATALMLVRNDGEILLPESPLQLQSGDRILFAGPKGIEVLQKRHYLTPSPLPLIRTGIEPPRSWVFRKLETWLVAKR
ncbi:MAG: NAD-binding protein [Burkholderiales bacterium]|jgi:Trk K+ transport system NAD-binding subunit|nr:NAD-binding protein [Burkholderiales bacterium]